MSVSAGVTGHTYLPLHPAVISYATTKSLLQMLNDLRCKKPVTSNFPFSESMLRVAQELLHVNPSLTAAEVDKATPNLPPLQRFVANTPSALCKNAAVVVSVLMKRGRFARLRDIGMVLVALLSSARQVCRCVVVSLCRCVSACVTPPPLASCTGFNVDSLG